MAASGLIEGRTGTLPDGTRVIVRGGKMVALDATGTPAQAPVMVDTKTDQDAIQKQRDQAAGALQQAQMAERFMAYNKKAPTGPGNGIPLVPFIPKFMGESPTWGGVTQVGNPNYQAMKSIAAKVGPGLRPPGSGSSSDKDTQLYLRGFPEVTNWPSANDEIRKGYQTDSNRENAKAAFLQTWMGKRGSLLGADQAFNSWWSNEGSAKYDLLRPRSAPVRRPAAPAPKPADDVESIVAKYR